MTGFELAPGAVGREAARVSTHGSDYDAALHRLRERGNGASSWGDDGLFSGITAAYGECLQTGLAALTGVAGEIDGTGEGLMAVSKIGREAEAVNAENVDHTWV
ncbi:hypothetical protein [Nonomuraea sp. NPDC002799]